MHSQKDFLLTLSANFVAVRSQRLCHALKILIETEKQLQSSRDHATRVVAALLEFASDSVSNITSTNIVLPKDIISAGILFGAKVC